MKKNNYLKGLWLIPVFIVGLIISYSFDLMSGTQSVESKDEIETILEKFISSMDNKSYVSENYYFEHSFENDELIMLNEGLGYFISCGENSSIPIDKYRFLPTNIIKNKRKENWLENLKYLYKNSPVTSQNDICPGYMSLFHSLRVVELYGILNVDNIKNYKFQLGEINNCYRFEEKGDSKFDEPLYGYIYLNSINEVDSILLQNTLFYSDVFHKSVSCDLNISFKKNNHGKFYIDKLRSKYKEKQLTHIINVEMYVESCRDIFISTRLSDSLSLYNINPFVTNDVHDLYNVLDKMEIQRYNIDRNKIEWDDYNNRFYYYNDFILSKEDSIKKIAFNNRILSEFNKLYE